MELYRGMSTVEWKEWLAASAIPTPKNFTSDAAEALAFGRKYLLEGRLFVLAVAYDDLLFQQTVPVKESDLGGAWFENTCQIGLGEILYSCLTPHKLKQRKQSLVP